VLTQWNWVFVVPKITPLLRISLPDHSCWVCVFQAFAREIFGSYTIVRTCVFKLRCSLACLCTDSVGRTGQWKTWGASLTACRMGHCWDSELPSSPMCLVSDVIFLIPAIHMLARVLTSRYCPVFCLLSSLKLQNGEIFTDHISWYFKGLLFSTRWKPPGRVLQFCFVF
jgi:hypothetical protein